MEHVFCLIFNFEVAFLFLIFHALKELASYCKSIKLNQAKYAQELL